MATWECRACSTTYAVGAPACPQCGSTDRIQEDRVTALPTLRVACTWDGCRYCGVVREVRLRPAGVGLVEVPALRCSACGIEPRIVSGWPPTPEEDNSMAKITVHGGASNAATDPPREEEPSPGTSSSPSSEKQPTKPEQSARPRRSRARTTANRSKTDQMASSSAPTTDGDPTEPTSETTSDEK